jgi:hypothetical protein
VSHGIAPSSPEMDKDHDHTLTRKEFIYALHRYRKSLGGQ